MTKDAKVTALHTYIMRFLDMVLFGSATPLSKLVTQAFPVFIARGCRCNGFHFFKTIKNLGNYYYRNEDVL
jgi:hypothetical protein